MEKSRQEIPQWSWYNGQFLFQFDEQLRENPNQSLSDFFTSFITNQRLPSNIYHTKNQGTIILLLYGLLVIPKEIWEQTSTNFPFETRSLFEEKTMPTQNDSLNFLRLLRNSLAHANFSVDTDTSKFMFWNIRNNVKNFEVEITYNDLGKFLTEIGLYYINEVKASRG